MTIDDDDPLAGLDPLATVPVIAVVSAATRMTDGELANLLGVSRVTVNLWKHGRVQERYTTDQRRRLRGALQRQRFMIDTALAELDA